MEIVRYPDSRIEVLDDRFAGCKLANAALELLWTGGRWLEGPAWFGDGRYLLFSDIPNDRILKWEEETGEVSVFRKPSNNSNGNTRDRQGRLVTCEHRTRRVTRTEPDGSITVLIDRFEGGRLNAPNDVVVKSDGSIWFTDPGYGILMDYEGGRADFENPANVYRLDPETGEAAVAAGDFRRPNGICFSPDESLLYVVDTGRSDGPGHPTHIRVFDVEGERLANGRVFADMEPGASDGIRTDIDGNLWSGACWGGRGVRRRPLLRPGRRPDRQDPPAGPLLQPLLRGPHEEPAVHDLLAVAVLRLPRDQRGADSVAGPGGITASADSGSLPCPGGRVAFAAGRDSQPSPTGYYRAILPRRSRPFLPRPIWAAEPPHPFRVVCPAHENLRSAIQSAAGLRTGRPLTRSRRRTGSPGAGRTSAAPACRTRGRGKSSRRPGRGSSRR